MHKSVLEFVRRCLNAENVCDETVLEVGSAYVNGSFRPYVEALKPFSYIGVDAQAGPGVDVVADCEDLSGQLGAGFGVVISTEMLEHVRDWRACVRELATVVKPGGLLLITTRSPGFPYHGFPEDHWRYDRVDIREILTATGLSEITVEDDPEAPGVFALARKPMAWQPNFDALQLITPKRMTRYPRKDRVPGEPAKQVVAFPMYKQVPVPWFFNWLQMAKTNVVGTVATDGMYLPQAMETLVARAFDIAPDFDQLVVMEHDMMPPLDGLDRMAQYGPEHDIVGTVYTTHEYPHHYMAWMQIDPPRFSPLTRSIMKTWVDSPGLYRLDGVAMGFTAISRRVFTDWDPDVPMWVPTPPMVGHDLHFCNEAKKQGFGIWLDSGIGSGHLTLVPIGHADAQAALAQSEPETWAEALARSGDPAVLKEELAQRIGPDMVKVT